jgi:transcriptional regulator with XRE-family HTH domain
MTGNELAVQVKKLRIQRGMTQAELARRCSMTPANLAHHLRKGCDPKLSVLVKLAAGLSVTLGLLLAVKGCWS